MPKEFHQWMSDMSNSIEDKSEFIKPTLITSVTALQSRLCIANTLVPVQNTEELIQDWVTVFCVDLSTHDIGCRSVSECALSFLVGGVLAQEYYNCETYYEANSWLFKIKNKIIADKL